MQTIIDLWWIWFLGMLIFSAYSIINQLDRIGSILKIIDAKVSDIARLFFNGPKLIAFVISSIVALGFLILFIISLVLSIAQFTPGRNPPATPGALQGQ